MCRPPPAPPSQGGELVRGRSALLLPPLRRGGRGGLRWPVCNSWVHRCRPSPRSVGLVQFRWRLIMPIDDWTRVPAGTYHFFHQRWISALADALNGGGLPEGFFAMSEVDAKGPIPDVLTLKAQPPMPPSGPAGLAVLDSPPAPASCPVGRTRPGTRGGPIACPFTCRRGELIAVIEVVSPGRSGDRLPGHADLSHARSLRPVPAGGVVPGHLGRVPLEHIKGPLELPPK